MIILNVAEKPSVAKQISKILSRNSFTTSKGHSKYNMIYTFPMRFPNGENLMHFTSVSGHISEMDFPSNFRNWLTIEPQQLFDAPVFKPIKKEMKDVVKNFTQVALNCDLLYIWTDCDREGENIGRDIANEVLKVSPKITEAKIYRGRFSALIATQIERAVFNMERLNQKEVEASDARQELDLREGCVFTRFQSIFLRKHFPQIVNVVSYGPCQFPTLGFIVERYEEILNFKKEKYWGFSSELQITENDFLKVYWERNHFFDKEPVISIYETFFINENVDEKFGDETEVIYYTELENKVKKAQLSKKVVGQLVSFNETPKEKFKPLPFNTISLTRMAAKSLKMAAERTMQVAESLYTKGLISYPRTETDSFPNGFDFQHYFEKLKKDCQLGNFVAENFGKASLFFEEPRKGKRNDEAHPPIYPTSPITTKSKFSTDELKLHELVLRNFLACCMKNAKGLQTSVCFEVGILKEKFWASGLQIKERGFLDVYEKYDPWKSKTLPKLEKTRFYPFSELSMKESTTEPPGLLTESELISLMDKNGIGTDATIAQHILTIQQRNYTKKQNGCFKPTRLGYALIKAYLGVGINLVKPEMRAALERRLKNICEGGENKNFVIKNHLEANKQIYLELLSKKEGFFCRFKECFTNVTLDLEY